ncbi:MAG: prepilin-type N-terminal cleavage/methylation domain-containing protein [Chitinophagaceae bacterium]|nr:prepilin-type N-terminal cleavage/methylation domain-containing protein [Oligoflexus sp.]
MKLPFPPIKMASKAPSTADQSGMTLLEIIFSVTLMLIMTMATSSVLRNGLDMRIELSQRSRVTHRLNLVLQKVSDDLQHAFIVPSQQVFIRKAEIKTIFRLKPWENSSELRLTTMNHVPHQSGMHESDQTFVMYRIEKDNRTNRPNLYRGETAVVPENLDQDIPMSILSRNIKAIKISPWNGEDWRDEWDSNRSDWRDELPRMVRVEVEAYAYDPPSPDDPIGENDPTIKMQTVVFIPRAVLTKEPKDAVKTPKYY